MRRLWSVLLFAVCLAFSTHASSAPPGTAARSLDDYRHFRIAAIDLLGRMPTRDEVAAFEKPTFDFDRWIDQHLQGPAYTERLTRIYMDLLRLEPNLNFSPGAAQLFRHEVSIADGSKVFVYYRNQQRRVPEATDGEFCFSPDEIGVFVRPNMADAGATPKTVTKKLLEERTVLVHPWWLYRDYKSATPKERYLEGWKNPDPQFKPVEGLLLDPDGKTPTETVRVCKEEAAAAAMGHIYLSGRTKADNREKGPGGRPKPAPIDKPFALQHKNQPIACDTRAALENAVDCGCGQGLERCIPSDGNNNGGQAFYFPNHMPLGPGSSLDMVKQRAERWVPYWWSRETAHFLDDLFGQDRDFRLILTGRHSFVNGPLAQFYGAIQKSGCCGPEANFGMVEEDAPLFDPKNVPAELAPQDIDTWKMVADRGPHAAGILTTPMFLQKYATARARGAVLYNAFLCKSFIAENTQLTPSTEPNLMKRPGCQVCHATLEPLAAYFARVEPSSSVFLPANHFPAVNPTCKKNKDGSKLNRGECNALYDIAFTDDHGATLRSAYGSLQNADAEPAGAGKAISAMPEFAECAVQRVTSSFLGRQTSPDDAALLASLQKNFVGSGFKMKTLVRDILRSREYREANNAGVSK
jgi:hypothetical protein